MIFYPGDVTFASLLEAQRKIQTLAYGKDPADITDDKERIQFIKDMELALRMELAEMLDETGWKPWATSNHVNEDAAQGELIDTFLFFLNLCLIFRFTPEQFEAKFFEKIQRNLDRQLAGYDGVTGKCVRCKRALDDTAVTCYDINSTSGWCGELDSGGEVPYGFFMKAGRIV